MGPLGADLRVAPGTLVSMRSRVKISLLLPSLSIYLSFETIKIPNICTKLQPSSSALLGPAQCARCVDPLSNRSSSWLD